MSTFTSIRDKLNKVPCINWGGCGIAALSMYRWRRTHGYQTDGFMLVDDMEENQHNRIALESKDYSDLRAPGHVFIRVGRRLYDSRGIGHPPIWDDTLPVSEDDLIAIINHADNWNDSFDRETHVPFIESLLSIDLSDIRKD